MILGRVVDGSGSPICTEMWPGNTADVTVLLPVIDRLRQRFGIGRVCIVADRGMISAETITGLEQRKLDYILGARERSDALVRKIVLANESPFVPLLIERQKGETLQRCGWQTQTSAAPGAIATCVAILEAHCDCEPAGASHGIG